MLKIITSIFPLLFIVACTTEKKIEGYGKISQNKYESVLTKPGINQARERAENNQANSGSKKRSYPPMRPASRSKP